MALNTIGTAKIIIEAVTSKFEKDLLAAMARAGAAARGSGQNIGANLTGGAVSGLSRLDKQALETYKSINRLIEGSYYMQGAVAGIVPVIGSLVGGLFALGSQLAAAAPALIVFPSLLTAVGSAALIAKSALSGVFKAVGQLNKQKTSGVSKMPSLLNSLGAAQQRVDRAQRSLNDAYRTAAERLQQLGFDSEDAAIGQKRAALELEKARETLQRVQDLPPNSTARREAELAFAEADLNYRKAIDRNKDLQEETKRSTNDGAWSTEQQVENSREVLDAQLELKNSLVELAKAKEKFETGGATTNPLQGLTDSGAALAKKIADLKPELDELKAKASEPIFAAVSSSIDTLVAKLLPELNIGFEKMGVAIGKSIEDFTNLFTSADNLKNLNKVFDTNADTAGKLGKVAGNLSGVFLSLLAAADPLVRRFTDWVVTLTDGWKASAEAANQSGKLTGIFNQAGDVAAQLGRIVGNLGSAFFNMGKAAAGPGSGGQLILDYFEKATDKFKTFAEVGQKDGSLEKYFITVSENFTKIMDILGKIGGLIARTGDDASGGQFLDSISRSVDILAPALERLTQGGAGGAFGKFIEQIAQFLASTTESGSLKVYFAILTNALSLLNKILENPIVSRLFAIVTMMHGARLAFTRAGKAINLTKDYIKGSFVAMKEAKAKISGYATAMKNVAGNFAAARSMGLSYAQSLKMTLGYTKIGTAVTKAWTKVQAVFNAVMSANPIMLTVIAIAALIAIVVVMYNRFKWFRDFVQTVWEAIRVGAEVAWNGIVAAFQFVWGIIGGTITWTWENVIQPIFRLYATVFTEVWGIIFNVFQTIWRAIYGAITWAWENVIRPVFRLIGSVFGAVWDGIRTGFTRAWDFITGAIDGAQRIFGRIGDAIRTAFRSAINFIIRAWNGLEFRIPGFKLGNIKFDGFTLGLPDIPELAEGGIVNPKSGGTLARIAEAGKAERIEPLDADGLSKRDKSMIKLLAGGSGAGMTVNVYPSPGMDERELASLVSRQIAFQMRKGAA